ncbi:MAG: NAD(P)H-dependent oxidoreductase subunit E [Chloroflexota bacterium]
MPDQDSAALNATLRHKLLELAPQGRSALLPALHLAQSVYGYLPQAVAAEVAQALRIPLAEVHGVIEFYSLFYAQPVGRTILRVCTDPACALAGGEQVLQALGQHLGLEPGETRADGEFTLERAPCLGLCEHAPALLANQIALGEASPEQAVHICQGQGRPLASKVYGDLRLLTANCGKGRPTSLSEYLASGGYTGLKQALGMAPAAVIAEVQASGLVGRGGAAFPTGLKWEGAAKAGGERRFVVGNADESEPGTFKDRVLMEEDPQRLLEGLAITAYAIQAAKGYIYVRGEYPQAFQALSQAVEQARQAGYLGDNLLGSQFSFDVELRLGAGAYICGEETALFESIEGKRGLPRLKPPFPTTYGLFGQPTVINNVETLCNVPYILEHGAAAYRKLGTEKSPGSKLFCLSGDVARPGLYEVPFGASLRRLLEDLAGGVRSGRDLQAVLFGGAAGAFATPDQLDVAMSFEDLRAAGLPLGSGVVLAIDESRDLRQVLLGLGRFFAHESCGKCYPCQLGARRQYEILQRLAAGEPLPGDAGRLADVGWTMSDASICGLGQTAATAVLSALKLWPEIFTATG